MSHAKGIEVRQSEVDKLFTALGILVAIAAEPCEIYRAPMRCGPERTWAAKYGADRVCTPCFAYRALADLGYAVTP